MDLAVDIGNTYIKAGLFLKDHLVKTIKVSGYNYQRMLVYALRHNVNNVIVSSVRKDHPFNSIRFKRFFKNVMELTDSTNLPIKNLYKTPDTLGKDRIAGAVGANTIFPNQNVLFVDMGSAITLDLINKESEYIGGNISPGLKMRYKALNTFTNKLPLLQPVQQHELIGQNTEEAIQRGIQYGILFEIEQYIKLLQEEYHDFKTILTGGDLNFFDNKLNYTIFVESNLILIGLNKILKYNIYES